MLEKIISMPPLRYKREHGFTLNELLIVVGIVAVLSSLAVPSYQWAFDKYRLRGVADTLRGDLHFARVQAISSNQKVYVNFSTGSSWCYGMNIGSNCTCSTANSCTLKQVNSTDYTGVTLATASFVSSPIFDPVRGIVAPAGNAVFQSGLGKQAQVNLSLIGKVGVCDPSGASSGYPSC
jgi:type IV fimbrial biogenesis protein FimT